MSSNVFEQLDDKIEKISHGMINWLYIIQLLLRILNFTVEDMDRDFYFTISRDSTLIFSILCNFFEPPQTPKLLSGAG